MLPSARGEETEVCAGIPALFLSQEIVGSLMCQFKITRQILQMLFLAHRLFDLLCFQLFFFVLFSFYRPQLQSWQNNYTKCERSFPLVFGGRYCFFKCVSCFLHTRAVRTRGTGEGNVAVCTCNFSPWGWLGSWETASCGFPFRVWPQVWSLYEALYATRKAMSALLFTTAYGQGSVQRAGMCMTMRTVNIGAVWRCQEISPFGRWGSCCVSELENVS